MYISKLSGKVVHIMKGSDAMNIPEDKRHTFTKEEASRGGKRSVEVRRRKKTLKDELIALLEIDNNNSKVCLAVLEKALKGDISAFSTIRDTIGEKPVEKIEADVDSDVNITIELSDD